MQSMWVLFIFSLALMDIVTCGSTHRSRSIINECPSQENIPKCDCKPSIRGLTVVCSRIQTDTELQSHLKILHGYYLVKFEVRNYKASSFPTTLLKGQEIKLLQLENVEVSDASFRRGQRHFQGLENSLESLHISKSFKGGRPLLNLKLDHMESLQFVIMEHNEIPEVGNDWFSSGPKNLSVLILEGNGIEELGDQAFSSLTNLRLLAVAGNHLNSITRKMLPNNADHLTTLDLSNNKLRILPNDIFSAMPALEDVSLENNLIHVIKKDTWGPVSSQLNALRLRGNVLHCDDDMRWICDTKLKSSYGKCSTPVEKNGLSLQQFCKF